MSTNPDIRNRFEDLAAGYVLKTLDTDEQIEFEELQHEASEHERALLVRLKEIALYINYTIDEIEPSPALKKRIIEKAEATLESRGQKTPLRFSKKNSLDKVAGFIGLNNPRVAFGVAASLAALCIICFLIIFASGTISQENQIQVLTAKIEQQQKLLDVLGSQQIDFVVMAGEGETSHHYGKVVWDPVEMKAVLQVRNLPKTPEGKNYQLWLQRDNKTINAGVFDLGDSDVDSFFHIEKLAERHEAKNATFLVTLENKDGAERPTGPRFLVGKDV
ncbi:MAG: anti-sigma factor [Balneola sp.]